MSTKQTDQSNEKPIVEESRLQYVDDLAGPEDYWISITDAARVTRTSEAMARRWVTSGRLPVKRDPVGLNQRTRMVRASDLQKIRTIIDPSAAITDDVRKLDLISIPKQQHEIVEEQHRLVRLVDDVRQAQGEQETRLQEQMTVLREEIVDEGLRIGKDIEAQMQPMHEALTAQEQAVVRLQESIQAQEARTTEAIASLGESVARDITQATQPLRDDLAHQQQSLTAQEQAIAHLQEETHQAIEKLRTDLERRQDEALAQMRQDASTLTDRVGATERAMETLERDCVRDLADFAQKLERYDEQVVQLRGNMEANRSIALGSQKRVDRQDEQITELRKIDLLSIPRQQQQIVEEQQRIVRLVEESNAVLATQEARMQEQATMLHEEIANEGLRVERGIEGQMQPLRDGLATQEQATGRLQESIQAHIETTQQALATTGR